MNSIRVNERRLLAAASFLAALSLSVTAQSDDAPIGDAVNELPLFDAHLHYKEPAWAPYPVRSVIELMQFVALNLEDQAMALFLLVLSDPFCNGPS